MGYAPIPPLGTDFEIAMARTNDAILYGGTVYCTVDYDDEAACKKSWSKRPLWLQKIMGNRFCRFSAKQTETSTKSTTACSLQQHS